MASVESQVVSALIRNKDPHTVIGEDDDIFGAYADVIDYVREYYMKYKDMPTRDILLDEFSEIEIPETDGPTKYFVDRLKSDYLRRYLEFLLDKSQTSLDNEIEPPAQVLEKLLEKMSGLQRLTTASHDVNMTDYEDAVRHLEAEKIKSERNGVPGIPTGFLSIDANYPTGMAGGHSIVLLGFSGRGKSFFSAKLAINAWQNHRRVMVVSLEMTPSEYRNRLYAMMSDGLFTISQMGNATVAVEDVRKWGRETLESSADFIVVGMDDSNDMTPNKIQAKIDMYQPDLVIVDYLQLMSDNRRTEGMTPRMLNLSREIKLMAMRNEIPIVSISAVTDEENSKRETPPTLKQIAWSRGIEYDTNLAIAVHRYPNTNYVHIVCRKNRQGEEFSFFIEVDFDRGIWNELFDTPDQLKEQYA